MWVRWGCLGHHIQIRRKLLAFGTILVGGIVGGVVGGAVGDVVGGVVGGVAGGVAGGVIDAVADGITAENGVCICDMAGITVRCF